MNPEETLKACSQSIRLVDFLRPKRVLQAVANTMLDVGGLVHKLVQKITFIEKKDEWERVRRVFPMLDAHKNNIKRLFGESYFEGEISNYIGGYDHYTERLKHLTQAIASFFHLKGKVVLDAGCATGILPSLMEGFGADSWGIDISEWAVRNRLINKLVLGQAEWMPFRSKTFDCITAIELMEHLFKPTLFIEEARRTLRKEGVLVITTPGHKEKYERDITHIHVKPWAEWISMIEKKGFQYLGQKVTYFIRRPSGVKYELLRKTPLKRLWLFLFSSKITISFLVFKRL